MRQLLREPFLHFLVLAALVFGYFALVDERGPAADPSVISVTDTDVRQLADRFRAAWNRPPTSDELEALVAEHVKEEVLVREALTLGLDSGDAVIRNRLRLKMQFLTDSVAQSLDPEDPVLQAHLDANPGTFALPPRIAFDQVYLGSDPDPASIDDTLASLKAGTDPATLGTPSLLPPDLPLSTPPQVDRTFGTNVFAALDQAPPGVWEGPVVSGYGVHLVRVTDREEGALPPLSEIRDDVLFDWRRVQAEALATAQVDALLSGYRIETPDASTLDAILSQ